MHVRAKLRESAGRLFDFLGIWPVGVILAFLGAMFWAKAKDPFERIEFTLKTSPGGTVRGMAVLPKPIRPMPTVIFLHDAGKSVLQSGIELRQMAEMGVATVDIDYDPTEQQNFAAQFQALQEYIHRQTWAMTNAVAWVGAGLGADRMLSLLMTKREAQPQLLIALGTDWIPELNLPSRESNATNGFQLIRPVLLVHGESDSMNPVASVERLAGWFRTNRIPVELSILNGKERDFDQDRALLFRVVGEYCRGTLLPKARLSGFGTHRDMGNQLFLYLLPAIVWLSVRYYPRWQRRNVVSGQAKEPLTRLEKMLCWMAVGFAILAITHTAVHLAAPRLAVNEMTLGLARRFLVRTAWSKDFEELATNTVWRGRPLRTLIEHVELSNYIQELMYKDWGFENLDRALYSSYVLSPIIDSARNQELRWRRTLWESFYPRIRKERTTMSAAQIVVRHLRERVTIDPHEAAPAGIESVWKNQVTNEAGFEWIYVAALRSVGIPARLNRSQQTELWTGREWKAAPRPLISYWANSE